MNSTEKTFYTILVLEFEKKLNRDLTLEEKKYLKWLAKRHNLD